MPIDMRMLLWFGGVFFVTDMIDALWPPPQPVWNAALALAAMLACWARHIEGLRK